MSDDNGTQNERPKFKRVSKSFKTSGGARRGKPKLVVQETGACRTNSEGKDAFLRWVRDLQGDHTHFSVTFGGNEELGTMAIYHAKEDEAGAMLVSQTKNALSFHCGACFEENPLLRPNTTLDCSFTVGPDADGIPCLMVNIAGGKPTRTVKREPKDPKPKEEKKS